MESLVQNLVTILTGGQRWVQDTEYSTPIDTYLGLLTPGQLWQESVDIRNVQIESQASTRYRLC